MDEEMKATIARLQRNSDRYEAIARATIMNAEQASFLSEKIGHLAEPTTLEEFNACADAIVIAVNEILADAIYAPPAFTELDPTHEKGCCGCGKGCGVPDEL